MRFTAQTESRADALRASEQRYRDVVETQSELVCRYLPDTTLTFVNDAYCRCFGKTREESDRREVHRIYSQGGAPGSSTNR